MQALPHRYHIYAKGTPESHLQLNAANLADINVAPPAQFGGPGDLWSPEDLLMASVASCFILSFRAIARASNFSWISLECNTQGELDKLAGKTQFTNIFIVANLVIGIDESREKAERLLKKAEQSCLITNSLHSESHLECKISLEAK